MTTLARTGLGVSLWVPALALALYGANSGSAPRAHLGGPFYDIETSALQYNIGSGDFTAPSHLTVTRPGLDVAADSATGNVKSGSAVLRGNVRVHDSGATSSAQGKNGPPEALTCDQLDVDGRADTYHATGHPHYESGSRSADADEMLLDRKHKRLHLAGSVTIKDGGQSAKASVVDVDLKTGAVAMHGAPVELSAPAPAPSAAPPASPLPPASPSPPAGASPSASPSPPAGRPASPIPKPPS